jgi:hypothetical protein
MKSASTFAIAILLTLTAVVRPAIAAPLEACPYYVGAVGPSATENVSGIVLGSNNGNSATFSVVLYTHTSSYTLNAKVPGFGEAYDVTGTFRGSSYRSHTGEHLSIPILFATPKDGPIEAAYIQPLTPGQSVFCGAQRYVVPDTGALPQTLVELQRISATQVGASSSPATLAFRASEDAPTCSAPYVATRVLKATPPDYPANLDGSRSVGVAVISALLDETGRVVGSAVFESSHSLALDQAATRSATASTYSAAVFRCRPVPSIYRFRAEFSQSNSPIRP